MLLLSDGWRPLKYYNPKTGKINIVNNVEIKINGEVRKIDNKRKLKVDMNRNYPTIYAQSNKIRLHLYMHNAIISTFGNTKNIDGTPNLYIDHIDRNRLNYSLNNLRFVTPSENNLNRNKTVECDYYIIYDNVKLKINKIYKEKDKNINSLKDELNTNESIIIFSYNLIDKYKDNLNQLLKQIELSNWVNLNKSFSISRDGIVRSIGNRSHNLFKFSLGTGGSEYYRLGNKLSGRSRNIHVLMAETFLNNGKKLKPGLIVDHIDTNKLNNSIDNLRIVTPSENMKNELTTLKLFKPIKCDYNGKIIYFTGLTSCSDITGIKYSTIMTRLKTKKTSRVFKNFSNFQYVTENEINSNINYIKSKNDLDNLK